MASLRVSAGLTSSFELALVFTRWATDQGDKLNRDAIIKRFEVDRSTAYRWLAAWRDANARIQ